MRSVAWWNPTLCEVKWSHSTPFPNFPSTSTLLLFLQRRGSRTNAANYTVSFASIISIRNRRRAVTTERSPAISPLPHLTRAATLSPRYLLRSSSHLLPAGSGSDKLCEKQEF